MADALGSDAFLADDLDPGGRSATGIELVACAIPHRLSCETMLLVDAPNGEIDFGIDVRRWVGEPIEMRADRTSPDLDAKIPLVDAALHGDPRIASTQLAMTVAPPGIYHDDGSTVAILIAVRVLTITGDIIDRVVGISQVSVAFLAQGR